MQICATNKEICNIMQQKFLHLNLRFYETNNYQARISIRIFQTNMQILKVPSLGHYFKINSFLIR